MRMLIILLTLTGCQSTPSRVFDGGDCRVWLDDGGSQIARPHGLACEPGDRCRDAIATNACPGGLCSCDNDGTWRCKSICP